MADEHGELTARKKLEIAGVVALAFVVALSWLGLSLVVPEGPGGFLVSSDDEGGNPASNSAGTEAAPGSDTGSEESSNAAAGDDVARAQATATTQSTPAEPDLSTVSADEIREALSRSSRGVSPKAMTAIWATEPYWEVSEISTEAFRVSPESNHVFIVFLDTHTGALPDMNWTRDARLRVDGTAYEPVDGYTRAGGYHHMVAVVQFPKTVDGESVLAPDTERVTLQVVGVDRTTRNIPDDEPRNLSWQYPPPYSGPAATGTGGS
jgi:hypothetical protein